MKIIYKTLLLITIIAITLFLLTGCGYGIKQGIIVDKQYHPEYTTYTYTTSNIGNSTIRIPTPIHHSETYNLKIQKEEDGKTKECWIQITEEEYSRYNIGDYYGYKEE